MDEEGRQMKSIEIYSSDGSEDPGQEPDESVTHVMIARHDPGNSSVDKMKKMP